MTQIFIDRISDVEIQQSLRLRNPTKIEEYIALALAIELIINLQVRITGL